MKYKLLSKDGNIYGATKINNNVATSFLFDPANTDYQEFLAWKSEGNEPEPADTPEEAE